jgi:hypothetical protein
MGRDDAFGSLPASAQVMLLRICSPSALSCVMLLDMVRLLLTRGYTLCGASLLICCALPSVSRIPKIGSSPAQLFHRQTCMPNLGHVPDLVAVKLHDVDVV